MAPSFGGDLLDPGVAARLCLSGQATLATPEVAASAVFLLQFALVTLPIGLLYALGMHKAQRGWDVVPMVVGPRGEL
jgi:hypothetical protein